MKTNMIVVCVVALAMTGCADVVALPSSILPEAVGFWYGLWHGMILPFAFIASLFDSHVAIYAVYNNGLWYNFGFVLGVGCLGGGASSRR